MGQMLPCLWGPVKERTTTKWESPHFLSNPEGSTRQFKPMGWQHGRQGLGACDLPLQCPVLLAFGEHVERCDREGTKGLLCARHM